MAESLIRLLYASCRFATDISLHCVFIINIWIIYQPVNFHQGNMRTPISVFCAIIFLQSQTSWDRISHCSKSFTKGFYSKIKYYFVIFRLYLSYANLSDAAFYQVHIHNTKSNIVEETWFWLSVQGMHEANIFRRDSIDHT